MVCGHAVAVMASGVKGNESERRSLDRIAATVSGVLDVPMVSISVVAQGMQVVAGSHGIVTGTDPNPLCFEVATTRRPILVQDARSRHAGASRAVPKNVVAYAGVPLPIRHGNRIGTLAAFTAQRKAWQDLDLVMLRGFAEAIAEILDVHARCDELLKLAIERFPDIRPTIDMTFAAHEELVAELESRVLHDLGGES